MTTDDTMKRLAATAGIAPSYWDIRGTLHQTSPEIQRALLGALGLSAETDGDARDRLHDLEVREWQTLLPPVTVCRKPNATFKVTVPSALVDCILHWQLHREDGEIMEGGFQLSGSEVKESRVSDGAPYARFTLPLPASCPLGYHRLTLSHSGESLSGDLIVAPPAAYRAPWQASGERLWGVAAHLYAVRSESNWGIGDLGDLSRLAAIVGTSGGDALAINPLHALFPGDPESASPYWPSSRLFLNPLYLQMNTIPELRNSGPAQRLIDSPTFRRRISKAATAALVPYSEVAALKNAVLKHVVECFETTPPDFQAFVDHQGSNLKKFALFSALSEFQNGQAWQAWPKGLRYPEALEVTKWADAHRAEVRRHMIVQWLLERQLIAAAEVAGDMKVGLMRDLAVGVSADGADAWCDQALYAFGASFGAPPDDFAPGGQNWGMPPPNPVRMREEGYRPFIATLRANMAHAGALRIDHAMGMQHLFWIPRDGVASDGAYVHYPFDDLLGILALESVRHQCLVVGEDLGTVAEGFRERMEKAGVLSTRLFYFERHENRLFKQPALYPAQSVAQATSHDLPTLAGYWQGRDLAVRHQIDPDYPMIPGKEKRSRDLRLILAALQDQGLIDAHSGKTLSVTEFIAAVHRFLARSPAQVALLCLDDLVEAVDQLNVPGTTREQRNWRHRFTISLEKLPDAAGWQSAIQAMVGEHRSSRRALAE